MQKTMISSFLRRTERTRIRSFGKRCLSTTIKKVGVIGVGLMGSGIAQVSAQAGYDVVAIENNQDLLDNGIGRIEDSLNKVMKRKMKKDSNFSESDAATEKEMIMKRITKSINIEDIHDCDLIVEAIIENMPIKLEFYKNLKEKGIIKKDAIIGSNTSSLPITEMANVYGNPANFVGLHFFNPVQIMKLVEVVKTKDTSDDTLNSMYNFSKSINKNAVTCTDTPGFIVNRLLVPYLAQAMAMVDRKVASNSDIDLSMKLGAGHPMGPLELSDYIGLDTCHSILAGWIKDYPDDPAFFIPDSLDNLVKQKHYGRKSGKGFYNWDGDSIAK